MSRVGEVSIRLKLAASERERAEETRRHVEKVVIRSAVDELERLVHERFGAQAIVRVRRLAFRWRVAREELGDPATASAMAHDLAAGIFAEAERADGPARLRPDPEANVVVFVDAAHEKAVLLADAFQRRTVWFHGGADAATVWSALQSDSAEVAAVTSWLENMDLAAPVLAWLRAESIARAPERGQRARAPEQQQRPAVRGARTTVPGVSTHDEVAALVEPVRVDRDDGHPRIVASEAAGVWYLARLVLELDMAEALWCVGASEGAFLAHVAAAVLGGGLADPAWRWFGGELDDVPVLDVLPAWGIEEVRDKVGRSFDAAGLERLARELPAVTDGGDPPTRGLVSWCAAVLCAAFCARLGVPASVATVRTHVMIPGRFVLEDMLRIELAMELLDIDLRRAGLDFNPGHLPWLNRKVEIVFASAGNEL